MEELRRFSIKADTRIDLFKDISRALGCERALAFDHTELEDIHRFAARLTRT